MTNPVFELTATYAQILEATERLHLETAIDVYRQSFTYKCPNAAECKLAALVNGQTVRVVCGGEPCARPENIGELGKTLIRAFNPEPAAESVTLTTDAVS